MNDNPYEKPRNSGSQRRDHGKFHDGERTMLQKRVYKRLKRGNVERLVHHSLELRLKWLSRRRTHHPTKEKLPVFIVGCNRSGTNMVCGAIGKSPHGWDYRESAFSIAFNGYYLRQDWIIDRVIRHTPAPIISFGSILDSQFTDDLISQFEGARAIWVYRRYEDVASSCTRMQWGHRLKDYARWVAHGELENLGARGKRISTDTVQLFGELFREDLSIEDGACLYWYMRNQLFFDLNLHLDPRVLILQYEDTVLNKEKAFRRVFDFLGFPFDPVIVDGIFATSVGKHTLPDIDPAIQEVCDTLQARLDTQYVNSKNNEYRIN